jgi:hypothetical protein
METTQGISLCTYLYLKLAKPPCFSFPFLYFFFYKIGEQEGRTGSARWEVDTGGGGRWQERGRRMNTVQILCTHICKCKNDTC